MNLLIFKIINSLSRHRFLTGGILILVLLAAGVKLFFLKWNNSIELMLPQDSDVTDVIYFLRDTQLADKIVLSFTRDPSKCSLPELLEETDKFASDLDPNLITKVVKGFSETEVTGDVFALMKRTPELLESKDYENLLKITSEEGVEKALKSKYLQLMRPQGSFFSRMFEQDPLDIQTILQDKIQKLSNSFGYDIQLIQERLVSSNQLHALMILDTPVPFTNYIESKILVDHLESKIGKLPQSITADLTCSHTHTVSNQAAIQHDIQVSFSVTGFAVLILFMLYFRDYRSGLIFLLPMGAVMLAGNLTALITGTMSPIVMGLGSVIIGLADDYGIHIYIAIRTARDALQAVKKMMRPLLVGELTTLAVFMAFLACSIPIYQYLAWFAFFGLILASFGATILLPVYIKPRPLATIEKLKSGLSKKQAVVRVVIFLFFLAIGLWGTWGTKFDSDMSKLDGTSKKYTDQERNFQKDWGDGQEGRALAVVQGQSFEETLEQNDRLYAALLQKVEDKSLASFSAVWKSEKERKINVDRWNEFWSDERISRVKSTMAEKAEIFGFADDAFAPFWQGIKYSFSEQALPTESALFNQFRERFVLQQDGKFSIVTFLEDTKENITILNKLKDDFPNLKIISNRSLSDRMNSLYTKELVRIVWVALALVAILVFVILRNIRMMLISFIPEGAALIGALAIIHWRGDSLNVAYLMALIVLIGSCLDFGVFIVFNHGHKLDIGTSTAVTVSAATTLIGAGALLFAHHPTLFDIGSTIVAGITISYLVSIFVLPAICSLLPEKGAKE